MEHEKLAKSHGILIFSHGILLILPQICIILVAATKKISSDLESHIF